MKSYCSPLIAIEMYRKLQRTGVLRKRGKSREEIWSIYYKVLSTSVLFISLNALRVKRGGKVI